MAEEAKNVTPVVKAQERSVLEGQERRFRDDNDVGEGAEG